MGWGGGGRAVVRVRRLNLSAQIFDVSERGGGTERKANKDRVGRRFAAGQEAVAATAELLYAHTAGPGEERKNTDLKPVEGWEGCGRGGRRARAKGAEPRASCTSEPPTPTSSGGEPHAQSRSLAPRSPTHGHKYQASLLPLRHPPHHPSPTPQPTPTPPGTLQHGGPFIPMELLVQPVRPKRRAISPSPFAVAPLPIAPL